MKVAERLSEQRRSDMVPLNVCIQVNISEEPQKAGIKVAELNDFAEQLRALPRLRLRGLMTIPKPEQDFAEQSAQFAKCRLAMQQLQAQEFDLDTLSMGTSGDFTAAIAQGATIIRIGTALFGSREV